MNSDHLCRWVRPRLPLLAGGELGVDDRRTVERHLIGCSGCRDRKAASTRALTALRSFAQEAPAPAGPSIWPSLAAEIRRSRHATPRPAWRDAVLNWLRAPLAPAIPFRPSLGLAFVAAAGLLLAYPGARGRDRDRTRAQSPIVVVEPPVDRIAAPAPAPSMASRSKASKTSGALPDGPNPSASDLKPIEPPPPLRLGYDLDHGSPTVPGNADLQRSY
jgi:hypothetical protein